MGPRHTSTATTTMSVSQNSAAHGSDPVSGGKYEVCMAAQYVMRAR